MLKVENIKVSNIKNALHGMRNPMASWNKADSIYNEEGELITLGENDRQLAIKLVKSGSDHRKFIRQIFFCADITAPDYWWKEMDTYKVATVANSTSTMHKLTSRELIIDDFSFDEPTQFELDTIYELNSWIKRYQQTQDKKLWRRIIQNLPMSFNYTRTWSADYETLRNLRPARRNHKLNEWHIFCDVIENLPLSELITINPWWQDEINYLNIEIDELHKRIKQLEENQ
jgi:hypothetical protein